MVIEGKQGRSTIRSSAACFAQRRQEHQRAASGRHCQRKGKSQPATRRICKLSISRLFELDSLRRTRRHSAPSSMPSPFQNISARPWCASLFDHDHNSQGFAEHILSFAGMPSLLRVSWPRCSTTRTARVRTWRKKPGRRSVRVRYTGPECQELVLTQYLNSVMYNDVANSMDSADMLSSYGPTSWGTEMYAMGLANAQMNILSAAPPYGKRLRQLARVARPRRLTAPCSSTCQSRLDPTLRCPVWAR